MSRQSNALRPEVFRGFSRVELRANSKVLLATLLITDDDMVGPDEIGLAEPAFRASANRSAARSRSRRRRPGKPRRRARQNSGPTR